MALLTWTVNQVLHAHRQSISPVTTGQQQCGDQIGGTGIVREHGSIFWLLLAHPLAVRGGRDQTDLVPSLRDDGPCLRIRGS